MYRVPLGPFEFEEPVGKGGMGEVWEVRHRDSGKRFALKRLHPQLTARPDLLTRFWYVVAMKCQIDHPNVARLVHYGADATIGPYVLYELVEGVSLKDDLDAWSEANEWYPWPRMKKVLLGICEGLIAVHEAGVLHRDLKPENVMLQGGQAGVSQPSPAVKLIDFGIATPSDPTRTRLTSPGLFLGTYEYIAPEQLLAKDLDVKADLYSLGVIFYELLSNTPPFEAEEYLAKLADDAPKLTTLRHPQLATTRGIEPLLYRLLAREPEDRPESARQVLEAISKLG